MEQVYELSKNGELLAKGTIKSIAEEMGVEKRTLRQYTYPGYLEQVKENPNKRVLEKVEDEFERNRPRVFEEIKDEECPECENKMNKTSLNEYFCVHCLVEYKASGEMIRPIY